MELKIKTFMPDSRRPAWLTLLLYRVRTGFPLSEITRDEIGAIFSSIETEMKETLMVRRSRKLPISECVRWEIEDNKLTIYTLYKDNPVVEFSIVESLKERKEWDKDMTDVWSGKLKKHLMQARQLDLFTNNPI